MRTSKRKQARPAVRAVKQLPDGPVYWIDALKRGTAPVHDIHIGTDDRCAIPIQPRNKDDQEVICTLKCTDTEVLVCDPVGGPAVNLVTLTEGRALLRPGVSLSVRDVQFVACDERGDQAPEIVGANMNQLVNHGIVLHGDKTGLARALNVKTSTFHSWVNTHRFDIFVLTCVLFGYWSVSSPSVSDSTAPSVAPLPAGAQMAPLPAGAQMAPLPAGAPVASATPEPDDQPQAQDALQQASVESAPTHLVSDADANESRHGVMNRPRPPRERHVSTTSRRDEVESSIERANNAHVKHRYLGSSGNRSLILEIEPSKELILDFTGPPSPEGHGVKRQ